MSLNVALSSLWFIALYVAGMSYLYKSNIFFKAVIHMIVGILAANFLLMNLHTLNIQVISPILAGDYFKIISLIFALLLFAHFIPKWRWLARYPTAILVGTGLGLLLRVVLYTDVLGQIRNTILPITTGNMVLNFGNIVFIITTMLTIFYFFFGFELKGILGTISKLGRFTILIGLGAQVGGRYYGDSSQMINDMLYLVNHVKLLLANIG